MTPFLDVSLQPGYGAKKCVVRWRLAEAYKNGDIYVYKAPAAQGPWTILNDNKPVQDASFFTDDNFVVTDSNTRVHYRLLLEHPTGDFDSAVVGLFDHVSRQQFGIVKRLMSLDLLHKRQAHNGFEVLVYKPKTRGPYCVCVDKETGQSNQASLCPYCFGTTFDGGYHAPVVTWLEIDKWSPRQTEDKADGAGSVDMRTVFGSALAFPELTRGDVIIHREIDNRYAVNVADPQYFSFQYPIGQKVQLTLLPRQDTRYQIPLPE